MVTQLNNKRQSASSDSVFANDVDYNNNDFSNKENNSINERENKFWTDNRRWANVRVRVCGGGLRRGFIFIYTLV